MLARRLWQELRETGQLCLCLYFKNVVNIEEIHIDAFKFQLNLLMLCTPRLLY